MTRQSFLDSLTWIQDMPPVSSHPWGGDYIDENLPPIAIQTIDGYHILGDMGLCDCFQGIRRTDIIAYAFLWR